MKILLTGSGGFIGRNLKEKLERKYDLLTPDRNTLNLLEQQSVWHYLEQHSCDVVIHCANANNSVHHITDYELLNQNLQMFYNLEKCHCLYGKMYYFGSGAEYDMDHYIPQMKEDYFGRYIPQDPYGFSKYTMSRITEHSTNIYDLRLFGVYGKYEEWARRFISNNLCKSIKNMDMTINQNARFDYLYVDDLCRIMEWFIENRPSYKHYNICTGCVMDLYTIAEKINKVTGLDKKIRIFESGWKKEYSGDNSRIFGEIEDLHFTPMEDAIKEMYTYYLSIQDDISL